MARSKWNRFCSRAPADTPPAASSERLRERLHGTVSRKALIETYEPRVLLSADLLPIAGAIDAPGEQDRYAITVAAPARVSFDSLTDNDLSWRLEGREGVVASGELDTADAKGRSGPPTIDLLQGRYTLTVEGVGGVTGDYSLRLLDLADAVEVTSGESVSATLDQGNDTRVFAVDARAGDTLFLDVADEMERSAAHWSVLDPTGVAIDDEDLRDLDVTLGVSGRYTVLLEGAIDRTTPAEIAFTLTLGREQSFTHALGAPATGTIATVGERHVHAFDLAENTQLRLFGIADSRVDWSLRGPDGEVASYFTLPGETGPRIVDLQAGVYSLVVEMPNQELGDYAVTIEETGASYAGTPLMRDEAAAALGEVLRGTVEPGEVHRRVFTITQETQVRLEALDENLALDVSLESLGGAVIGPTVLRQYGWDERLATLAPGTWALVVRHDEATTQEDEAEDYAIRVVERSEAIATDLSAPLVATLEAEAQVAAWSTTLAAGDRVVLNRTAMSYADGFALDARLRSRRRPGLLGLVQRQQDLEFHGAPGRGLSH